MTRDEIIRMAREAWGSDHEIFWFDDCGIERFAALVAAAERAARQAAQIENEALKARIARADVELHRAVIAEREACAKVADGQIERWTDDRARYCASECAAAIRARGAA